MHDTEIFLLKFELYYKIVAY